MTLDIIVPTLGDSVPCVSSWLETATHADDLKPLFLTAATGEEAGYLHKLQYGYEQTHADVIGYLHNDVVIHEPRWDDRVMREFEQPDVAVVSFFGARTLGTEDIYRVPYDYHQLARGRCLSNMTDAEVHGERSAGPCDVAMIDSFSMFVRRDFLTKIGGWRACTLPNTSHCTDVWICAMTLRMQQRIRFVGVSCTHAGGGKGDVGSKWLDARGGDEALHRRAHRQIYDEFRDVLPWEVRA